MTNQQIYQALRARLNTLANKPPIAYLNQPYTPVNGTAYLAEDFLPANNEGLTVNGAAQAKTGIYQITVFYPDNQGVAAPQALAEAIAVHFDRGTELSGIIIDSADIEASSTAGGWFQIPISVVYRGYRN